MPCAVIEINVADEVLTDRLVKRGQDSGRADDNVDTIKQRLTTFHNQTVPVLERYKSTSHKVRVESTLKVLVEDFSGFVRIGIAPTRISVNNYVGQVSYRVLSCTINEDDQKFFLCPA